VNLRGAGAIKDPNDATEGREFAERLVRARAGKGLGFSETPQSVLGEIHLNYGEVCGLYNEDGPEPDEMLAGFVIHASDFSAKLPSAGPHPFARRGRLRMRRAVGFGPWSRAPRAARRIHPGGLAKSESHPGVPFVQAARSQRVLQNFRARRAANPVALFETLDGDEVWVQAMVLEGLALEMTVNIATAVSLESFDGRTLKFRNPFPMVPRIRRRIPARAPRVQESPRSRVVVQFRR
jgi:hypothetical protein